MPAWPEQNPLEISSRNQSASVFHSLPKLVAHFAGWAAPRFCQPARDLSVVSLPTRISRELTNELRGCLETVAWESWFL